MQIFFKLFFHIGRNLLIIREKIFILSGAFIYVYFQTSGGYPLSLTVLRVKKKYIGAKCSVRARRGGNVGRWWWW